MTDFAVAEDRMDENPIHLALLARLATRALGVRVHGSAALDLAWDVSAGALPAREAGARTPRLR